MVVCSAEGSMVDRGKVGKQLVLVLLVVLQITMAPVILFSLTYLVHIDYDAAQVSIRTDLIHWVVSAGLTYGLISIALAWSWGASDRSTLRTEEGYCPH